jgi:hypothetical protein
LPVSQSALAMKVIVPAFPLARPNVPSPASVSSPPLPISVSLAPSPARVLGLFSPV